MGSGDVIMTDNEMLPSIKKVLKRNPTFAEQHSAFLSPKNPTLRGNLDSTKDFLREIPTERTLHTNPHWVSESRLPLSPQEGHQASTNNLLPVFGDPDSNQSDAFKSTPRSQHTPRGEALDVVYEQTSNQTNETQTSPGSTEAVGSNVVKVL